MKLQFNEMTIGEVVTELTDATLVFDKYGIDFCCGGNRSLKNVIKQQNLSENEVYTELQKLADKRASEYGNKNFNQMEHSVLSRYIEDTHHSYLREKLPDISEILNVILRVHGKNHKELFDVFSLFGRLKSDLELHLLKEETMLFPAFSDEEGNSNEIANYTKEIVSEHEEAGRILQRLREVTNNYEIPEDACPTFENAYEMLKDLENDLHQHIHLENNILLKEYDKR